MTEETKRAQTVMGMVSDGMLLAGIGGALICAAMSFFTWHPPEVGQTALFEPGRRITGSQRTNLTVWRLAGEKPAGYCTVFLKGVASKGGSFYLRGTDPFREEGEYTLDYSGNPVEGPEACEPGSELAVTEANVRMIWLGEAMRFPPPNMSAAKPKESQEALGATFP
jgi:hypothetical protein